MFGRGPRWCTGCGRLSSKAYGLSGGRFWLRPKDVEYAFPYGRAKRGLCHLCTNGDDPIPEDYVLPKGFAAWDGQSEDGPLMPGDWCSVIRLGDGKPYRCDHELAGQLDWSHENGVENIIGYREDV